MLKGSKAWRGLTNRRTIEQRRDLDHLCGRVDTCERLGRTGPDTRGAARGPDAEVTLHGDRLEWTLGRRRCADRARRELDRIPRAGLRTRPAPGAQRRVDLDRAAGASCDRGCGAIG